MFTLDNPFTKAMVKKLIDNAKQKGYRGAYINFSEVDEKGNPVITFCENTPVFLNNSKNEKDANTTKRD